MTAKEQIESYLKDLPSKWKDQLTALLCDIIENKSKPDCEDVKDCQTLTSLSNFSLSGTIASITYKDENKVSVTRSFNVNDLINNTLDDIDPNCLTSQSNWNTLSYVERIQLLIDEHCECCE